MFSLSGDKLSFSLIFTSCVTVLAGLLLFLQGFLLTRQSFSDASSCSQFGKKYSLNMLHSRIVAMTGVKHFIVGIDNCILII